MRANICLPLREVRLCKAGIHSAWTAFTCKYGRRRALIKARYKVSSDTATFVYVPLRILSSNTSNLHSFLCVSLSPEKIWIGNSENSIFFQICSIVELADYVYRRSSVIFNGHVMFHSARNRTTLKLRTASFQNLGEFYRRKDGCLKAPFTITLLDHETNRAVHYSGYSWKKIKWLVI